MRDGDDLAPDVIVESVDAVGVDEAVPDPAARLHRLLDLSDHLREQGSARYEKREPDADTDSARPRL